MIILDDTNVVNDFEYSKSFTTSALGIEAERQIPWLCSR